MRIKYTIVYVSDMASSVSFYRDVLGIPIKFESPGWTEFLTDGATLALHKSDGPAECRHGFQVPNLDEFHERMIKNNVQCAQEPTETFGVRIGQYVDPDGLVFSVGEARTGE